MATGSYYRGIPNPRYSCPAPPQEGIDTPARYNHAGPPETMVAGLPVTMPPPLPSQGLPLVKVTPHGPLPLGLSVPEPDLSFWMDAPVLRFLAAVAERSRKGESLNVLLVGPTGTGKSSLPREIAARWQRPFFTMHCQMVTEPGEWWGTRELSPDRGTYFLQAALVDAVETPGSIILLDEANRTHPENINALFGFLDHRRRAWIPVLHREIAVAPGVVFFVTLNEGMDYAGTNPVDRALRDRISNAIRLDYPPKAVEVELMARRTGIDEDTAWKLATFAATIRGNPKLGVSVSTRQLLECAALAREGLPLPDAVLFAVVNSAVDEVDRKALLQSLQVTGAVEDAYTRWHEDDDE